MSERSIPAIALPSWAKAAARCGFNIEPIFAAEGIELDLMRLEQSRVSLKKLDRVLEACMALSPERHFPFVVGETFAFEYLPDLETFLTTSSSLRDAARVLDWIPALVNPMIDAGMEESAHSAHLVLHLSPSAVVPGKPYHAEMFFASIVKFARALAASRAELQELRFRHAAPEYSAEYEAFYQLPVLFGQARDELLLSRKSLDQPLGRAYPALHKQAEALVEQRIAGLQSQPLAQQVDRLLARDTRLFQGGLRAVASALNMGERTLQRRLKAEDTSFAETFDRARYRFARQRLEAGSRIDAVSEALGFSDRRSFSRAFKRWSGQSPSHISRQA